MRGVYFHIPFCLSRCPYCDFFSILATEATIEGYATLLINHLNTAVNQGWEGPIDTIYFGGGTPSLLKPHSIGRLLESVDRFLGISQNAEISLEANPGTINLKRLVGYRSAGVNRLSLGLQTLTSLQLKRLGRPHSRQENLDAIQWARRAGFGNLSIDLMFALPEQTLPDLHRDLTALIELSPEHVSCYGLALEAETLLAQEVKAGRLHLPEEDFYADAYLMIHEQLLAAGFEHYEIANYARPSLACRHNLGYWNRQSCLGLGAGAHTFSDEGWGSRWAVPRDLNHFRRELARNKDPAQRLEHFDRTGALSETIYLALRTSKGITERHLLEKFGCRLQDDFPIAMSQLSTWLKWQNGTWRFSPAGWLLYDRLIQAFL